MARCVAVLLVVALASAAGCDDPEIQEGLPCSEADTCPPEQVCDPFDRRCRRMPLELECRQDSDCASGVCDDGSGTCVSSCRPETCVAGPCEEARCEGDRCVVESLCGDGETCCGGACMPAGCDDGDPCTADSCGAQGCEHTPASGASCDDGVHCNGADTCVEGVCQGHAGDPCAAPTICDEAQDSCIGCLADTDCPATEIGAWSECEGFADVCDASGTASRDVTTYTCQDSVCVSQTVTESEACDRVTEGVECGTAMYGPWSTCDNSANTCSETGTMTRTVTAHACADESCASTTGTETAACERETDGLACGTVTCGAWSDCNYLDGCDENATRSRQCTSPVCSDGACIMVPHTETESCNRETDGNLCSTSCGAWGGCDDSYSNVCDETGSESRTCTTKTCSSGACTNPRTTIETRACSRDTDDEECGNTTCGPWGACDVLFECGQGARTRTCQTPVCDSGTCDGSASETQTQTCTVGCPAGENCAGGVCCPPRVTCGIP